MVSPMPYDESEYHIQCLADNIAQGHPEVQRIQQEAKTALMAAVNQAKGQTMRQNRSSADKYPMPALKVEANPLGMRRGKGK